MADERKLQDIADEIEADSEENEESGQVEQAGGIKIEDLAKMLKLGTISLKSVRGISDAEMNAAYALAHDCYTTGRYDDAETLFRFLTTFDHLNGKYWMGMGAVHQVKKRFREAAQAYALVIVAEDARSVDASFHAAECFLALGDRVNATSAIAHVRQYADPKTERGRTVLARVNRLEKLVNAAKEG